jgi:hypothetical protein
MYTNFLDDGRYTDAVPFTQTGHVTVFPLVCPDTVKPLGASWMQTNMIAYNVKYLVDTGPTYSPLHSRVSPYLP